MGKTSIEWTDASWNPVVGCTEISPGCANCYAARLAATRLKNIPAYKGLTIELHGSQGNPTIPRWTGDVRFLPERLEEPLHWRKPRRIFVCDMGDLFHEDVQDEWITKVFQVIAECPQHTFQVLTKRAARMHSFVKSYGLGPCPIGQNHLWLGVSVENQHFAEERIPLLLQTPAAVRFISAEPLLGRIDLRKYLRVRKGQESVPGGCVRIIPDLDWVICGGESGPGARPMHPDWARSLRDQCQAAGVPFFFKQWGEWAPCSHFTECPVSQRDLLRLHDHPSVKVGKKKAGRVLDGRTWEEFPGCLPENIHRVAE